ncbi:acetyl-CoA synthetase-like protein [Mycena maculata]|uniref:Acetyl-CoA synthetase-like protein n=1 Tax=Mycena maculata TaxID=230809 RepID=A0AAD7NME4_9AGAR|nr:acetyl-CoA synthetase-like protein [Mycena maculata]
MGLAQSKYLIVDSDLLSFAENLNEPSFLIIKTSDQVVREESTEDVGDLWADYQTADPQTMSVEARGAFALMQTSGSTGHPKIIPYTHQWILTTCATFRRERSSSIGCTLYTPMPLFHSIGVLFTYVFSVGLGGRVHFFNLRQPPTAPVILRHLALHGEQAIEILLPPSILEDVVDGELRDEGLIILKRASILYTGGAPLRKDVGDFLRHNDVPLQAIVGMTETGPLSGLALTKDAADWQYGALNSTYGYFFKSLDAEGTAKEMIVLPNENTPCVLNHRNPEGLATNDMWERHPDPAKSHLWKIVGRADDVTVLSNGEKTNNKQLEILLCTSPLIGVAAIFGSGRFLNGAILSPPDSLTTYEPGAYLDAVWPHITENVNPIVPQHSRLIRPLVLVADLARPFILTDKRTLNRKRTLDLYVKEIEAAYTRVEEGEYEEIALPEAGLAPHEAQAYVQSVVQNVLQRSVDLEDDLFDAGLESLLAMRIRSSVIAALRKSGKVVSVPQNIVYSLPTQKGLAVYLQDALASETVLTPDLDVGVIITDMVDECTRHFPEHRPSSDSVKPEGDVYAVTGTTGSLGSFLVALLLNKPTVRKVYLLNRKAEGRSIEQRHQSVFQDRGLDYELLVRAVGEGRAVYVEAALGQTKLGLSQETYEGIRMELTHIVHCAWTLNFNLILSSFKSHVWGVRNLIDLALSSPHASPAHLTFLSSVAVVAKWEGTAPEASMVSHAACLDQGYAQAKYVAEKIIERAVAQCPGFKATIIRSGQISGAEGTGAWSTTEHIPILMKSCRDFGIVPDGLPTVRWLPVNIAAEVVFLEIQTALHSSVQPTFYNLENSVPTPWSLVANSISKLYILPIVPAVQWLKRVRKHTDHPANKLLPFFEEYVQGAGMPPLQLHHAREAAGNLVDCAVDEELVKVYVEYACR